MASTTKVHGATIAASVAFHAALAAVLSWIALRSLEADSAIRTEPPNSAAGSHASDVPVELPSVGEGILVDEQPVDPAGEPPRVSGGETVARLDTGSPGHGGDARVATPALNLADRDERMRLSPDVVSHLDRDQLQRLRVARVRESWEDRRATTHPTELTLLVTGMGTVLERRPASPREPNRGVLESHAAGVRGSEIGSTPPSEGEPAEHRLGGVQPGSFEAAPGTGLPWNRPGPDHRASAPVSSARPDVTRAAVAVPAIDPARPTDNVYSDQEVATTVQALVHASTAGGLAGPGRGGNGAGGEAGAGGASGAGSRAHPLGFGEGDVLDSSTNDPRLLSYYRQLQSKINPLWANAFPKSAVYDLKQGTVILEFTVFADGHVVVSWPPARPSGIDEFDRNCADAIRRAAPLPPIPRQLGVNSLRVRYSFIESNPIVK